jgi:DNA helicase HerA-like ATPase
VVARRAGGDVPLALALTELDPATQAAMLRLDPVADREEYGALTELVERSRPGELAELGDERLAQRARNLGIDRWGIWSGGRVESIVDQAVSGSDRCLVVDLGSLATREEQALASTAILAGLWRERERRRPVLLVIDEAHNVCPAEPEDPLRALASDVAVRIAAEGRKFGLYLLVSTQRPQKIPENLLSQCDNLVLMRMNSQADLAYVAEVFSFVPPSLLARATTFRQGECLVAGKIAPHPAFLRVGERVSVEGGGDVPADWARPA